MVKSKSTQNPISRDFTLLSLLQFAFPSMITMLFMGLYTMADTIFVSRFVNTNALSAVNIVCPVINMIVGLGTMIAIGGSAVIARKMGAGETKRANQDFTLLVLFGTGLGLMIAAAGIAFIDRIVWRLGASEVLFPYCKAYLLVILVFTPASILQVVFQNLIITAGKPTLGLALSAGAGVMNILLDYIFMAVLNMGIVGAALGTGMGYVIPSVIGIIFFNNRKHALAFTRPAVDISVLKEICVNGSSEMVSQMSAAVTTFFFNQTMMKLMGENGVAAITILIYGQFLMTTLYIGFSMGIAPIISFHYGAGNEMRLKKVYKNGLTFIIISSSLVFLIAEIGNRGLAGLFAGAETEVYQITTTGFKLFAFSFLFSGINIFSSAMFTAVSNGKLSAVISFLRTFGFLMMGLLILPRLMQVTGVFLSVPIAEALTFGVSLFFHRRQSKASQRCMISESVTKWQENQETP
jgi:Na+-driven multidrug efflux pump